MLRIAGFPEILAFLYLGVFPEFSAGATFSIMSHRAMREQDNSLAVIMDSINEVVVLSVMEKGGVEAAHGFEEGSRSNPCGSVCVLYGVCVFPAVEVTVFEKCVG